jgi:hypothetical protein
MSDYKLPDLPSDEDLGLTAEEIKELEAESSDSGPEMTAEEMAALLGEAPPTAAGNASHVEDGEAQPSKKDQRATERARKKAEKEAAKAERARKKAESEAAKVARSRAKQDKASAKEGTPESKNAPPPRSMKARVAGGGGLSQPRFCWRHASSRAAGRASRGRCPRMQGRRSFHLRGPWARWWKSLVRRIRPGRLSTHECALTSWTD